MFFYNVLKLLEQLFFLKIVDCVVLFKLVQRVFLKSIFEYFYCTSWTTKKNTYVYRFIKIIYKNRKLSL